MYIYVNVCVYIIKNYFTSFGSLLKLEFQSVWNNVIYGCKKYMRYIS